MVRSVRVVALRRNHTLFGFETLSSISRNSLADQGLVEAGPKPWFTCVNIGEPVKCDLGYAPEVQVKRGVWCFG